MAKKPAKKILRVGLIQNQRILEERLFRKPQTVTVGHHYKKNTLVVPASNLPRTFPVFEWDGKGYVLQFTEKMEGRVSRGNGVETLEELRNKGAAKKKGKVYRVRLTPKMRGRVAVGEATILFQFVTPPPERARPVLPASMKGGLLGGGIDRPLAVAVAIAAILQVGFVLYLEFAVEITDDGPYRVYHDDVHAEVDVEEEEDEDEPEEDEDPDEVEPEEAEEVEPAEPEEQPDPEDLADQQHQDELDATEEPDDVVTHSMLGAIDDEGGMESIVDDAVGDMDMAAIMDGAETTEEGDVGGPGPLGRGDGSDDGGRVEGEGVDEIEGSGDDPGGVDGPDDAPVATVTPDEPPTTPDDYDPGEFVPRLRSFDNQIESCYQAELTVNRQAAGEILMELTIEEDRGWRITGARAIRDTVGGDVASCIASTLRNSRMPAPDGDEAVILEMPYTFAPQ